MRKPFWKKRHKCWYYRDERGKDVRLDPDEDKAFDIWRDLINGKRRVGKDARVCDITNRYLDWSKINQAEGTYEFHRTYLESFREAYGSLKISALANYHVTEWVTGNGWTNPNTINGAVRAVQRAFNWAVKETLIRESPIVDASKPAAQPREVELTAEQFQTALAAIKCPAFRDAFTMLRETGCRPLEFRKVENRHFDRRNRCWQFPRSESKGKRRPRIVRLSDKAFEITERWAEKNPSGPIFRNHRGKPWSKSALTQRCERLSEKVDIKIRPYSIRHHFVDEALDNNADPIGLSILLGHASPKMVMEVYQNMAARADHLKETLHKATNGNGVHRL